MTGVCIGQNIMYMSLLHASHKALCLEDCLREGFLIVPLVVVFFYVLVKVRMAVCIQFVSCPAASLLILSRNKKAHYSNYPCANISVLVDIDKCALRGLFGMVTKSGQIGLMGVEDNDTLGQSTSLSAGKKKKQNKAKLQAFLFNRM